MFCDRNYDGIITPNSNAETSELTQENSYYAFGMNMEFGAWENTPSITDNLKQYNGKELSTDFGLNWNSYEYRNYDAAICKFTTIDPLTEGKFSQTPYAYAANNPIVNIDYLGLSDVKLQEVLVTATRIKKEESKKFNGLSDGFGDMAGGKPDNEYDRIYNKDGTSIVTQKSDFGGDDFDIFNNVYGNMASYEGLKNYSEIIFNTSGGQRLGPGVFQGPLATGGLTPDYTIEMMLMPLPKIKLFSGFSSATSKIGVAASTARLGGRLGNAATRAQVDAISTILEKRGYIIIGGGQRGFKEEYLRPLGGGRVGGSYIDITATHPKYGTLRINTVDTYSNGLPTLRELTNAARIRTQIGAGEHLLLIPK